MSQVRRTAWALTPPILLAVSLSVGGLILFRALVPYTALRESNDSVGNYVQALGTIYAVLLAFVVVIVWQQFNEARGYVDREANELHDLARTVRGFPTEIRVELHPIALSYVTAVLDKEWAAMGRCDDQVIGDGDRVLDRFAAALYHYQPAGDAQCALYQEVLARLNDLSDSRSNRLSANRQRIPLALTLLLYIGAVVTVGSMYLFAVERFAVHALITGAMAGMISHILYLISDLDDCFGGNWQVSRAPFERVRTYLGGCCDEVT